MTPPPFLGYRAWKTIGERDNGNFRLHTEIKRKLFSVQDSSRIYENASKYLVSLDMDLMQETLCLLTV